MSRPVIIIGAGIVGLSTAWALRQRSVESVIIDRDVLGDGASYGNAGLIIYGHAPLNQPGMSRQGIGMLLNRQSPLYIRPSLRPGLLKWLWGFHQHCTAPHLERSMDVLAAMGWGSKQCFEEIIEKTGIDADWQINGWLDLCPTLEDLDHAESETALVGPYGFTSTRLEGQDFHTAHPGFTSSVAGAVHYHHSATLCPRSFSLGLRDALVECGISIREGVEAKRIETSEGQVTRVRLADGNSIEADQVVLAAGTWSTDLARSINLSIPMEPARGYHRDLIDLPYIPKVGGVIRNTSIAFTPMFDRLRLAGTLEIAGYNRPWMKERLDNLSTGAAESIQGISTAHTVGEWAGYRPCTPDGLPVVGKSSSVDGLHIATGHAMMGMTLGPYTGEMIARSLCGETQDIDDSLLTPDRFN